MSMSERSTVAKPRLEASMPIPSVTVFSVKLAAGMVTLRNRPSMSETKNEMNSIALLGDEAADLGHVLEAQHDRSFSAFGLADCSSSFSTDRTLSIRPEAGEFRAVG